jgi:CheY-like chemotaxis protein
MPQPESSPSSIRGEGEAAHAATTQTTAPTPTPPAAATEYAAGSVPRIGASAEDGAPPPAADRERLVLIADPVIEEGKSTASTLAGWGLQPILVHDGVEAILTIQRTLPRSAIIDAALPKMYGFQICELLKRNESLRHINVVLVGAIHDRNRYRRSPTELYGADAYLERPQLPDALWPILHGFGMPLAGGVRTPEPLPAPTPEPAPIPEPAPASEAPADPVAPAEPPAMPEKMSAPLPAAAALSTEIANAERLARIVVSDIVLYNQEKFDAAVQAGNVLAAMDGELEEGRGLFAQRIDARVRESRDFLNEEMLRVARMRRSQ